MRLMRWLSAGKSLVGMRENVGRYQMTHERLLPDFRVDRPRSAAAAQTLSPTEEVPVQKTVMNSEMKTTQAAGQCAGIWQRVMNFFNELLPRRKVATGNSGQPVVQGELSLDSVKVMRNDLSDSDLEVVTRRPVPERPMIGRNAVATLKQTAGELIGMGKS